MPRMADLIRALGGPELRHGRCRAWWRGGDGRNISVDDEQWYCHVTGRGGGPLQLAEVVLGEAEGRRWYEERYGRVRCRSARRVPVVPDELFMRIVAELADARKQVALKNDDDAELALWSPIDRIARTGGPEWHKLRQRVESAVPDTYRHWVSCAVEFDADSRLATALIVAMLAKVAK